ncbi:hypothetical protein [Bacillus sp. SM2101]|uniref:hypothetical protein n=1 Tax=Bacillus sp. SM2101 TaxID=2805366 RepID=UPI001BDF69B2
MEWERWMPMFDVSPNIYNESLSDSEEGFSLRFSDENGRNSFLVKFEVGVLSYTNTDKGTLILMLDYLHQKYEEPFYCEWSLFKVKKSNYLSKFLEESSGIYESSSVTHYVFLTSNDVIEVLSTYPPSFTKVL